MGDVCRDVQLRRQLLLTRRLRRLLLWRLQRQRPQAERIRDTRDVKATEGRGCGDRRETRRREREQRTAFIRDCSLSHARL